MSARLGILAVALVLCGCPVGLGERCEQSEACQPGLVCRTVEPDGPGVCDYPLKTEGQPCATDRECEDTLTCSTHFGLNQRHGQCVPRREAGAACFLARDCVSAVCDGATAEELGSCL